MIVRASRDLEAGTELTISYHQPDPRETKECQESLAEWGFECNCTICEEKMATADTVVEERDKLTEQLEQIYRGGQPLNTDKCEELIEALDKTYSRPVSEVPHILASIHYLSLVEAYSVRNSMPECIQAVGKLLTGFGFVVVGADNTPESFKVVKWGFLDDLVIESFIHARNSFVVLGALGDAEQAEKYAKIAYKVLVGEDTSFEATHGRQGG